jgi:hypothetical protein
VTGQFFRIAHQYETQIGVFLQRCSRRANDDLGAEIATHRIN